jgi:hypothetical protein
MLPGWTLARTLPPETIWRLLSGEYQLHGGVVRWAAGTAKAGQIVRHLIPAANMTLDLLPGFDFIPGIVANIQLEQLKSLSQYNTYQLLEIIKEVKSASQITQQILQTTSGTAVMSGLGLAVSAFGFVAVEQRLTKIDTQLKAIQKDIKAIQNFLESSERARLFAALNALLKLDKRTAREHRHTILHRSHGTLCEINMRYRELLRDATTLETAITYEEYFAITALAQVRCSAELGMLDIANKEIQEMNQFWQSQAKRLVKDLLLGRHPERFLASDFANDVAITELCQWLDFIAKDPQGLKHIDQLRERMNEYWYSKGWFTDSGSGLNRDTGVGLEQEKKIIIPTLRKLMSRSQVLQGFEAQYQTLEIAQLRPSQWEEWRLNVPQSRSIHGYLILEPEDGVTRS